MFIKVLLYVLSQLLQKVLAILHPRHISEDVLHLPEIWPVFTPELKHCQYHANQVVWIGFWLLNPSLTRWSWCLRHSFLCSIKVSPRCRSLSTIIIVLIIIIPREYLKQEPGENLKVSIWLPHFLDLPLSTHQHHLKQDQAQREDVFSKRIILRAKTQVLIKKLIGSWQVLLDAAYGLQLLLLLFYPLWLCLANLWKELEQLIDLAL